MPYYLISLILHSLVLVIVLLSDYFITLLPYYIIILLYDSLVIHGLTPNIANNAISKMGQRWGGVVLIVGLTLLRSGARLKFDVLNSCSQPIFKTPSCRVIAFSSKCDSHCDVGAAGLSNHSFV